MRSLVQVFVCVSPFTPCTYIALYLSNATLSLAGGNFTLAELGVCEPTPPPHPAAVPYCPDLGLLQRGYSLSAGSDADSDPEGPLSPERAIQLWAGRGRVKSRRSSGVSSHENSALTLTDSENDNKSDDESGRTLENGNQEVMCVSQERPSDLKGRVMLCEGARANWGGCVGLVPPDSQCLKRSRSRM